MKNVTAIVFSQHGDPAEVLHPETVTVGEPGPGEVLVEMLYAPINPADINTVEGKYPIRPQLPGTPGAEGVGVVKEVGPGVSHLHPGMRVLPPYELGTWREAFTVHADQLIVVPNEVPLEQAAMLKVNPATAWRLLHDYVNVRSGDWVIQNAANSGVGMGVIQIAHALGIRTVNVVRRPELIEPLKAQGADVVLCDHDDLHKQVAEATGGAKILLGMNAVGGENAVHVTNCLAKGGTLVTYGAMSRQPLKIPNGLLIFKDLSFRGCWVSRWYKTASPQERADMFSHLFPLAISGVLNTPIDRIYPLAEIKEAVQHAQQSSRGGKILLKMGA